MTTARAGSGPTREPDRAQYAGLVRWCPLPAFPLQRFLTDEEGRPVHLTRFIRERSDVELERLTRTGTRWHSMASSRPRDAAYSEAHGCLLCNAFDARYDNDRYIEACHRHWYAEGAYMDLAHTHGQEAAGALIARLARRELGRRAIAAIDRPPLANTTPEPPSHSESRTGVLR